MNAFPFPTIDDAPADARPYLEGPQKQLGLWIRLSFRALRA